MKKLIALLLALVLVVGLVACGNTADAPAADAPAADAPAADAPAADSGEKISLKFYGKCIEYTSGPMMTDAMEAALADKYDIESIQIDWANWDTVVRTGLAGNEPCDVYQIASHSFTQYADMAEDLTPYLDANPEFKAGFEGVLASHSVNGKVVALPWESNFTVVIGNKEALEAAGVEIPTAWTYAEFMEACETIQATGKFPFANATDLNRGDWLVRNALLSEYKSAGKAADYAAGNISWDDQEVVNALTNVKALYDNGYMYPGEGAVTVKNDEVKAAFYQGEVLMITEIAAGAAQTVAGVTDFTPVLIPFPSSASEGAVLGSTNCLFIPANSNNKDAAWEAIMTFLSEDIQGIHAAEGYIPANANVPLEDPFVLDVIAQASTLTAEPAFSAERTDYNANSMTADLVLNGGVDTVVENFKNYG